MPDRDSPPCQVTFRFVCDKQWVDLDEASEPAVRFCSQCRRNVYRAATPLDAIRHAKLGQCVAYEHEEVVLVGHVGPEYFGIDGDTIAKMSGAKWTLNRGEDSEDTPGPQSGS